MLVASHRWLERHEAVAAALAYALIVIATYSNIVFRGESLVYSNNVNMIDYRMTEQTYGPNFHPASTWLDRHLTTTANLLDPGATWTQWETGGVFLRRSLRQGELPFWDPYSGGGVPAMANLTQAFFFPPYFAIVVLGNSALLKNLYFLGLLLTAAVCTWSLLRRTGLSWMASFVGGATFLLSGALNQTVGSFIGQTACCIPMAVLATRWFLERATWTAASCLAVLYASIALASFPPILMAAFGLSALYAGAEIAFGTGWPNLSRKDVAIRFAAGALLGIGFVAWYYLPAYALMGAARYVSTFYRDASSQTPVFLSGLLQLLSPTLFGGVPVWANDPIPRVTVGTFNYVGVAALLLAVITGFRHLRQPLWMVAAVAAVGSLGLMIGVAPFAQIRELPVLRNVHFGNYYGIVIDFLLALFAAAGFERLRERGIPSLRAWIGVGVVLVAVIVLLLAAFGLGVSAHPTYLPWRDEYVRLVLFTLVGATLVFAAAPATSVRVRSFIGWAFVAVLVVEGVTNSSYPRQKRWDAWDHPPPYVAFLQQNAGLGRVFTMGGALYANSGSAFQIFQLDSLMTFNSPRMYDLYRRHVKTATALFLREAAEIPPEPVLDAASVSHLAIAAASGEILAELGRRGHQLVFTDGLNHIFRRAGLPRYFFTSAFEVSIKRRSLQDVGVLHPPRTIVLENQPSIASRPNSDDNNVPVKVERFSNNRVRLSLVAPTAGFVYASESLLPGWRATVNGNRTEIQPANYAFRAVEVPSGPATIEFTYVPPGLWPGLAISVTSLLIAVGLVGFDLRRAKSVPKVEAATNIA